MKKPQRRAQLALLAAAALTVTALLPGSTAVAKSNPGTQATIQVLASGLNVPRGLVFDGKNKRILVAESGIDAINVTGPCGIGEDGTPLCYADTGSVFQYSTQTGATSRIITGLPSVSIPDGNIAVLGLHDLALFKGTLHGVFGLLGMVSTREEFAAQGAAHAFDLGTAGTLGGSGYAYHQYTDITAFEDSLEPGQESDPYGIIVGGYGSVIANPGGPVATGNDVLQFKNGQLSVATSIATRIINNRAIESVPTCVTKGPDGAFYAGELSGFPYFPGVARIMRFMPGQAPTVYAEGFTNIIDCTFDDDGQLLVLEIAKFGLLNADQTGALIKVASDGTKTELASTGLTNPGGVAPAGDGVYYITNFTAGFGGDGELLKVTVP